MTALAGIATPLEVYEGGLAGRRLTLHVHDGTRCALPVGRWLGGLGALDRAAIALSSGPLIDVGCGPGRHVVAARRAGLAARGIDVSPAAVRRARRRGADAVLADVFAAVPGEGTYATVLLLDGNIGIGGDAAALLRRVAALLRGDGGRVLAEVGPPGSGTRRERVRLEAGDRRSAWFAWSRVAADGIDAVASAAGLDLDSIVEREGRWLAVLDRR